MKQKELDERTRQAVAWRLKRWWQQQATSGEVPSWTELGKQLGISHSGVGKAKDGQAGEGTTARLESLLKETRAQWIEEMESGASPSASVTNAMTEERYPTFAVVAAAARGAGFDERTIDVARRRIGSLKSATGPTEDQCWEALKTALRDVTRAKRMLDAAANLDEDLPTKGGRR